MKQIFGLIAWFTCSLAISACTDARRPVPTSSASPEQLKQSSRTAAQLVHALKACWLKKPDFKGLTLVGPQKDWRGNYLVSLREPEGTPKPNRNIEFHITSRSNESISVTVGPLHADNHGNDLQKMTTLIILQKPPCEGVAAARIFVPEKNPNSSK